MEAIFQTHQPALILFVNDFSDADDEAAHEAFKAYDETSPSVVLSVSRRDDGHNLYTRLAEYVGVDVYSTPKALYMDEQTTKYNWDGEAISADSLADFVSRVKAGSVEPYLKSAEIPESNDEPVKVVVGKSWKDWVLDSDKEVLVKFYAPWCGHCKSLAPHYEEAAKRIASNPNIVLVKVDSTENEVPGVNIEGFPTLKFFRKDKSAEPYDFEGGRDVEGILSWLKDNTEYPWVEPAASDEEL